LFSKINQRKNQPKKESSNAELLPSEGGASIFNANSRSFSSGTDESLGIALGSCWTKKGLNEEDCDGFCEGCCEDC